jgi:hypothetical protein
MGQREIDAGQNADVATSLLAQERRTHVGTALAAYFLGRRPQTMRVWASAETGPIRPVRVNGRLAWPVDEIRAALRLSGPSRTI